MAASSSSSSESETSGSGSAKQKDRALSQLPALARLAHSAPRAAAVAYAAAPATPQRDSDTGSAVSPAWAMCRDFAVQADAAADRTAGNPAVSPASAEPELAAVLRLRDHSDAPQSAGAALLSEATSSTATSLAAGRDTDAQLCSSQQSAVNAGALASNIVAAPQSAARVQVCQGKSCTKRGAADLLQQASAAGGGRPGIEVPPLPHNLLGLEL
jgi:hypothetical protein